MNPRNEYGSVYIYNSHTGPESYGLIWIKINYN
jgi:hypothetical protein